MPQPVGCCLCGLAIEALVETAHIPDRRTAPNEKTRLCILCHRAYDLGLMSGEEIKDARARWLAGEGAPYASDELHALWASRKPDWNPAAQEHAAGQRSPVAPASSRPTRLADTPSTDQRGTWGRWLSDSSAGKGGQRKAA